MKMNEYRACRWALIAVTAAALAACGGGGSSDDDSNGGSDGGGSGDTGGGTNPPVVVKSLADLQGRWSGTVGTQTANAMVLADGTAWVVQVDGADAPVAVTKGQWRVADDAYTGTGRRVSVGSGVADNVSMAVSSLTADASMAGTLSSSSFSWTYAEGGEASLTLAAMAGTWAGNVDAARATVTWTLTSAGALTGSSTTGCTYEGLLAADTGVAAVSLSATETCAGVAKALSGIGTLDSTGSRASFPYIADDESGAGVFRLSKQ